jgi:hypothetical protein
MTMNWKWSVALAASLAIAAPARAHDLMCEHALRVCDGAGCTVQKALHVSTYPARFDVLYSVFNVHPTDASVLGNAFVEEPAVFDDGATLLRDGQDLSLGGLVELIIPVGAHVTLESLNRGFDSFDACSVAAGLAAAPAPARAAAAADGPSPPRPTAHRERFSIQESLF